MIIQRDGALGDVLMCTPAVKELRRRNPDMFIGVKTFYPGVFQNSPYVDMAGMQIARPHENVINLNAEYEKDFNRHPVNAYAEAILGDANFEEKRLEIFTAPEERTAVDNWWKVSIGDAYPVVVVHLGTTWVKLDPSAMEGMMEHLLSKYRVILTGKKMPDKEYFPTTRTGLIDLVNKEWSVQKLQWLIEKANLFVGTDTGVMHIASTTSTPIVCCYSFIHPQYREPFREGIPFEPVVPLPDSCEDVFCAEKRKIMCQNGDFGGVRCTTRQACTKSITASMIIDKIEKIIGDIK